MMTGSDGLVGGLGTGVARGQGGAVLDDGERHQRVVDRAAGDPEPAEDVGQASGQLGPEEQWLHEPLAEQPGGIGGCQP
jgi:hypothetical protein